MPAAVIKMQFPVNPSLQQVIHLTNQKKPQPRASPTHFPSSTSTGTTTRTSRKPRSRHSRTTDPGGDDNGTTFLDLAGLPIYTDASGNEYIISGRSIVYLHNGKISSKDLYNLLALQHMRAVLMNTTLQFMYTLQVQVI